MYRVIKVVDGAEIGIAEAVNYVKIGGSDSFVTATKSDAIGTAFDSTLYDPVGYDEIGGAETVAISEIDGGIAVSHQQSAVNEMIQTILEGQQ